MKLTRQGVRDLGGGRQRRPVVVVCAHVWEDKVLPVYDYWGEEPLRRVRRCGFCGEVQS
jgi:hypothetical protein